MSAEILGVLIARVSGKSLGAEAKLDRLPPCYGADLVTGKLVVLHEARGGYAARPPVFESGAGGLVSTVDDLLAVGRMMLGMGTDGGERILSRPAIELMTRDDLTPEQKAASPFFEHFWETYGWGLGLGVVTARNDIADGPGPPSSSTSGPRRTS